MTPLDHLLALRRARDELEAITHRVSSQVEALYALHLHRLAETESVPDDPSIEPDAITLPDGRVIPFTPEGFVELHTLYLSLLPEATTHAPFHP